MAVATEPLVVPRQSELETLHYIQIVDTKAGHRSVTSMEFLSPATKASAARCEQYLTKQRQMLDGGVNLVEIDLLRAGRWVLAVERGILPNAYREPYRICVVRAEQSSLAEVYRVALREPLPTIRIPLRSEDPDVPLQLQTLIDAAYVNGLYGDDIDYREDPDPELTGPEAEWTNRVVREQGLR